MVRETVAVETPAILAISVNFMRSACAPVQLPMSDGLPIQGVRSADDLRLLSWRRYETFLTTAVEVIGSVLPM